MWIRTGSVIVALCGSVCVAQPAHASWFETYYRNDVAISHLETAAGKTVCAPRGWFYHIIAKSKDAKYYWVKFDRRKRSAQGTCGDDNVEMGGVYKIMVDRLDDSPAQKLRVQHLNLGPIVVPFKKRFKVSGAEGQLSGSAAVGGSLGLRMPVAVEWDCVPSAFVGFGKVGVSPGGSSTPKEVDALSYGCAMLFDRGALQIGAVAGWDLASGDDGTAWPYQNKVWVSIAAGYAFFGGETKRVQDAAE